MKRWSRTRVPADAAVGRRPVAGGVALAGAAGREERVELGWPDGLWSGQ